MIHSDWHIHTTASHDSWLAMETVIESGRAQGLQYIGIADHIDTNEVRTMREILPDHFVYCNTPELERYRLML